MLEERIPHLLLFRDVLMIIDEFEDETENWQQEGPKAVVEDTVFVNKSWRFIAASFFALMTLCTVLASGFYFRESGKNSQEEKKVAAGVADIAMALIYSQLNHHAPNKQNWSDPEFLNSLITKVVSPDLDPQAVINSQGQFNNYPYLLRVYTKGDMSQFLVIAQPAPNLFQWIIHKKAIVIDSRNMELRKISDLKNLNRLLANQNPLSGANGDEVSKLVKQGKIMSLASLAGKKNRWGFSPPKGLAASRPGAENYVYNAPRFFPFGESVVNKAIELKKTPPSQEQAYEFQQEVESLMQFPNLVLYSSKGVETATEAIKSLSIYIPEDKLTVAYIRFNDDGIVLTSRIVEKPEEDEVIETDRKALHWKLHEIAGKREAQLSEVSQKIYELIDEHNVAFVSNFHEKIHELIVEYEGIDASEQAKLMEELDNIARREAEQPLEKLLMDSPSL